MDGFNGMTATTQVWDHPEYAHYAKAGEDSIRRQKLQYGRDNCGLVSATQWRGIDGVVRDFGAWYPTEPWPFRDERGECLMPLTIDTRHRGISVRMDSEKKRYRVTCWSGYEI